MAEKLSLAARELAKLGLTAVFPREWRRSIILEGEVDTWQQYIAAGYAAAGKGYKGVVNELKVRGLEASREYLPPAQGRALEGKEYDAVIIGGGVIGCAVARELTRWDLRVAILEKEDDVAKQTSSRNNGMIHPGLAAPAGSKKLVYNIRGNRMYTQAAAELGFDFNRCGSVVMLEKDIYRLALPFVRHMALRKGVDGLDILSRGQVARREPNAIEHQRGGISLPSTGVVAPYKVVVAYAENAVENGAEVHLNTAVLGFEMEQGRIVGIKTNQGLVRARAVVNAAGVWSDKIAGFADDRFFSIHGRKGTIAILDKAMASSQKSVLAMPMVGVKSHTKGGGLNPTVEGNLLMGPTAIEVPQREDWSTTPEEMEFLISRHLSLNRQLRPRDVITYFAGVRACTFEEDFIIEPSEYVHNLVHAAGIQSPGLASAPAIAQDVAAMTVEILIKSREVKPNPAFYPERRMAPQLAKLSLEERAEVIRSNPAYGQIVCRCEGISAGEIIDAIHSPVPATSLDAVKRRVRAGMGRCQGGFCTPALLEILARETGKEASEITKGRPGSQLLAGETKAQIKPEGGKQA
jgi:glycerol-3-phosphate dehydrogenase